MTNTLWACGKRERGPVPSTLGRPAGVSRPGAAGGWVRGAQAFFRAKSVTTTDPLTTFTVATTGL